MVSTDVTRAKSHFLRNSRIKEFPGYGGKIHSISWNASGDRLASGSSDKMSQSRIHNFRGHADSVDQLSWHPSDSDILSSVSFDGGVRLWDCRSKKDPTAQQLKGENINITWSPDGRYIAVGNRSDMIYWLDVRNGLKIIQSEHFTHEINEFTWRPDGDLFFITTGFGSLLVYSGKPGDLRRQATLQAHPASLLSIKFSPNARYFAVGSADALVSIWDADEYVCLRTISRLEWPVRTVSFTHDSKLIAAASEDHFIDVGHVKTGSQIHQITTHSVATFSIAWNPKQYLLAYSSEVKYEPGTVRLFGLPSSSSRTVDSA